MEALARSSGTRPNVIIPAYVADVEIPKFTFHSVNTSQVFDALNIVSDERGGPTLRWLAEGKPSDPNRIWSLAKAPSRSKPETCQVTFIGELLDAFQLDDINAAIRTAWDMLGKPSTASLKFHKETRLLIAKGMEEELKLQFEVLNRSNTRPLPRH